MAFRTITVDIEAYELLRSRKRPGQSFSEVIRTGLRRGTGRDLLAALTRQQVAEATLEKAEQVIVDRQEHTRPPEAL